MNPEDISKDFREWPDSWMGTDEDLPYGRALLEEFRLFVESLIAKGLAKKTIRAHMFNLWLLGGEVIRGVSIHDDYNVPPLKSLRESVDEEGGPYCKHVGDGEERRSFDATCRKLHKFLASR